MIDYIGDVSKADAHVLALWGQQSVNILEFGCGASTQILLEATEGTIDSLDTSEEWIYRTQKNIRNLLPGKEDNVKFYIYDQYNVGANTYDFVFDDGVDHIRRNFGLKVWPHIRIGGWLALHDQRRKPDFDNTMAIIDQYWLEVDKVYFNHLHSNITFIQKKAPEPYDNWQISEKRTPQQLGY